MTDSRPLPRARPDQSLEEALHRAYGGSDNTAPSFNRPHYVRYFSVNSPRDFGVLETFYADIEGLVGSEAGAGSIFFRFQIDRPARVDLRQILSNPYTDQYVSVTLRDEGGDGRLIPIGASEAAVPAELVPTVQVLDPVMGEGGYVLSGYWEEGYAEFDNTMVPLPAVVTFTPAGAAVDNTPGARLPAGVYSFLVACSQWVKLPYRLQLSVLIDEGLKGVADLSLEPTARLGLASLAGAADLRLVGSARLRQTLELGGTATVEARPSATLRRVSPFG